MSFKLEALVTVPCVVFQSPVNKLKVLLSLLANLDKVLWKKKNLYFEFFRSKATKPAACLALLA